MRSCLSSNLFSIFDFTLVTDALSGAESDNRGDEFVDSSFVSLWKVYSVVSVA